MGDEFEQSERERDSGNSRSREEIEAHIAHVDGLMKSPKDRALLIYNILRENPSLTTWDVMCFCAEWMGQMTAVWDWLEGPAKSIAKSTYYIHYYRSNEVARAEVSLVGESKLTTEIRFG